MKKTPVLLFLVSIIIFAVSIVLGLTFNNILGIKSLNNKIVYWFSKITSLTSLLLVVIIYFKKQNTAYYLLQYLIAVIFQVVPLIIRIIAQSSSLFVINVIVYAFTVIVYLLFMFGLSFLSKKAIKENSYESKV